MFAWSFFLLACGQHGDWQYVAMSQRHRGTFKLNWWRMTSSSSPVHFWACPPMGLIAFTQTISQWPADETQNTKSSICKPHLTLHWECPCFLAAVRQHHDNHDQRHHCSQHKACAGSDVQAGQQVGKTPPAFDPFCMCLLGFDAAHAAGLPSGSTVLGQIYCPWTFNMPWVFAARILTAFCAKAFYVMLQMSPLSPAQTSRLLSI